MAKIIVNSSVRSTDSKEIIEDKKAIIKDDKITYHHNGVTTSVNLSKDMVILSREDEEKRFILKFINKKQTKSFYEIISLNSKMDLIVDTKKLDINSNSLFIKYDLYLNNQFVDSFSYNLEWRDL